MDSDERMTTASLVTLETEHKTPSQGDSQNDAWPIMDSNEELRREESKSVHRCQNQDREMSHLDSRTLEESAARDQIQESKDQNKEYVDMTISPISSESSTQMIDGVNQGKEVSHLDSDTLGETAENVKSEKNSDHETPVDMTISRVSSESSTQMIHSTPANECREDFELSPTTADVTDEGVLQDKEATDVASKNNEAGGKVDVDSPAGTRSQSLPSSSTLTKYDIKQECQKIESESDKPLQLPIENPEENRSDGTEDDIYVCFCCMQQFDSVEDLESHEQNHSNENPYRCSFCPRIFRSYDSRGEHEKACRETTATQVKVKEQPVIKPKTSSRGRKIKVKVDYTEKDGVDTDEDVAKDDIGKKKRQSSGKITLGSKKVKKNSLPVKKTTLPVKKRTLPVKKRREVKSEKTGGTGGPHVCSLCSVSFIRVGHLNRHLSSVHSVSWFPCKVCKKLCESKEELEKHEQSHTCEICGKVIKSVVSLIQHKMIHNRAKSKLNPTDDEKSECGICGMKFKYTRSAREHEKRHVEPPIYKCVKCPRKFATEEKKESHQLICKPNLHQCKRCEQTFKYRYQLEMHVVEVHTGDYYVCQLCGQKFSNKGTWKTHERLHTKEKEFICSICNKAFHFQASLNDHKSQVHSNEKPFQCMYCGIGVKSKGALKKHEGLHTGAFVFKCEYCDMQYNSRLKLDTHVQEKHTGRKFICKACGKGFTNARYLRNHELIHTGEKPYKCPHCGMGFRRQHHVTQHIPRHFKNDKQQNSYVDVAVAVASGISTGRPTDPEVEQYFIPL